MDPKQALLDALAALLDDNIPEARECLANYWQWIGRGGFDPQINGKDFARLFELALEGRDE